MKLLLLILGVVVVALNLLLWYSKKRGGKTKAIEPADQKDKLDPPVANSSDDFLNSSKAKPLKQSAAAELGISVEQLDRMPVEEIKQLAAKKGLI